MIRRSVACAIVIGLTTGCSILSPCGTDDLSYRVTPASRTIAVGESFTGEAEFLGCRGSSRLSDQISWSSRDTTVARVDASTGRVLGRSAGVTTVEARGERYGLAPGIVVTVR